MNLARWLYPLSVVLVLVASLGGCRPEVKGMDCDPEDLHSCSAPGTLCWRDFKCHLVCIEPAGCPPEQDCDDNGLCQVYSQSCNDSADCRPSWFCNDNHACAKALPLGAPCGNSDSRCASGHCSRGVCCNEACDGTCMSCLAADASSYVDEDGRCHPIAAGTDPYQECAPVACSGALVSGGSACGCPTGYEGDGVVCTDIDECAGGLHDCDPAATCSNTEGGYECACKPGYDGDGRSCADIDECEPAIEACDANATCTNTTGGYECECQLPFYGDGFACTQFTVDAASAGGHHTCAIRADGKLGCWGDNPFGQLGDGTTTSRPSPRMIAAASDWLHVSAGSIHTCGIRAPGTLWCWGRNQFGQLGDATTTDRTSLTAVGEASDWLHVAAGSMHTCGIRAPGTLWCWGKNDAGQIGNGTLAGQTESAPVGVEEDWIAVSLGDYFSCGLRAGGTLWCWGSNSNGELGLGTPEPRYASPAQVERSSSWLSVSAGDEHACAVRDDGSLWCWGDNEWGQLGDGTAASRDVPIQVGSETDWTMVTAGADHTCGLRADGTIWCWGSNRRGRLGASEAGATSRSPVQVSGRGGWTAVTAGGEHTCAANDDGTLWCFGSNLYGQLGFGVVAARQPSPVAVALESAVVALNLGGTHGCALLDNGSLWCWGNNGYGRLGDNTALSRSSPVQVASDLDWATSSNGGAHSCGVAVNGGLWCWGGNQIGQLGQNSSIEEAASPMRIGTSLTWTTVEAGFDFTCGLKNDGSAWCWGANHTGQLGDGTTTRRHTPTQVAPDDDWDWLAIAPGGDHTCAIRQNGSLWCWGDNYYGQLGGGLGTPRKSPSQTGTASDWTLVTAGTSHTCGIREGGDLWCWGSNTCYQIGNGGSGRQDEPVQVSAGVVWDAVSAGSCHTCGIRGDGSLWCWGTGAWGQLGTGSWTDSSKPTQVGTATNWIAIAAGGSNSCGLQQDGSVSCWGDNWYGQVGDGTAFSFLPVLVRD